VRISKLRFKYSPLSREWKGGRKCSLKLKGGESTYQKLVGANVVGDEDELSQKMTETISPAHRHKSESDSDSGTLNIHYFLVLVPQNLSQVIYQHCDIIY